MEDVRDHAAIKKFIKELNSGTVAFVLLAILSHSKKPLYGYEIAKRLEAGLKGHLPMKRGTLYPVLRSLEEQGLLAKDVEPSVSGPPRKYYVITEEGRRILDIWKTIWTETQDLVNTALKGDVG